MLLVIPVSRGDLSLALLNLRVARKLDARCPLDCLLSAPRGLDTSELEARLSEWCSARLLLYRYDDWSGDTAWPRPQNWAWQQTARYIATLAPPQSWLWWEADATPLRPQWFAALADAHARGGKAFAGHIVRDAHGAHLNGVAIYPADVRRHSTAAFLARSAPFDRVLSVEILHRHTHPLNDLIGHYLKPPGRASAPLAVASDARAILATSAVLYHGSSDGALARYMLDGASLPLVAPPRRARPLAISLLTYNRLDLVRQCLESLEAHTPLPYALTVTDNASTDGTPAFLAKWSATRPRVRVVLNSANLGYKEPHDAAFAHALAQAPRPEFFIILNNDVVLGEGWLDRAIAAFDRDPRVALVGNTGVCCNLTSALGGVPPTPGRAPEYIEGSLLCARVSHIAALGAPLFSPHLKFIYCEDCDLSLRAREAGFSIATVDLNCAHAYSQTVRALDPATKRVITDALAHNLAWMRSRWSVYARRRDFRYQVLVTRRHAFGDVIDVTPVVAALRKRWPACEIDVHTDFPDVFRGNPDVRSAQSAPYPAKRHDFRFDLNLAYEKRPDAHTLVAYADALGVSCPLDTALPVIYTTPADDAVAASLLPPGRWALLHAGPTGWPGKDWPPDRWVELAARLRSLGYRVACIGNGEGVAGALDLRRKTTVQVLHALLRRASLFVGLDSGPSHVAQAARTPSVVLFGTVLAERKLFPAAPVVGVQASITDVPCVGEHHRLAPPIEHSACTGACMRAITVDMVLDAVSSISRL